MSHDSTTPPGAERRQTRRRAQDRLLHEDAQREQRLRVETLHGTVRALAQLLAVIDAVSYTQALRVQRLALQLAAALQLPPSWDLETAALLAPLGGLTLAGDLQQRAQEHEALSGDEQGVLASLPALTDRLLAPVPGLEEVRSILLLRHRRPLPPRWRDLFGERRQRELEREATVLRTAAEFDALTGRGLATQEALGLLRSEALPFERPYVEALSGLQASDAPAVEMRSLPLTRLKTGMVVAEALYTQAGQLLVNRGFVITESFLERLRNFRPGQIREPVQVMLPPVPPA